MSMDPFPQLMQAMDLAEMLGHQAEENQEQWRTHLLQLLQVMDALDRTLESDGAPVTAVPHRTVSLIRKQLIRCLAQVGVEEMACEGQEFDPLIHHAVEVILTDKVGEDIIMEEIVAGYRWQGEVLRQPQVTIARPATDSHTTSIAESPV